MAYTGHGHHIPDTLKGEGMATADRGTVRCGGIKVCTRCKSDVEDYWASYMGHNTDFEKRAKMMVVQYVDGLYLGRAQSSNDLPSYDVVMERFQRGQGFWTATMSTTIGDGQRYEIHYNADRREMTLTAYQKVAERTVSV